MEISSKFWVNNFIFVQDSTVCYQSEEHERHTDQQMDATQIYITHNQSPNILDNFFPVEMGYMGCYSLITGMSR